jgi:hypothetical protein
LTKVLEGKMFLIDGEMIGTKTVIDKKPVLIEDLIGEDYINIRPDSYGVYIPEEELLKRNKYQWFTVMSTEEILQSRMALSKYFVDAVVNYLPNKNINIMENTDVRSTKDKTVFSI